MANAYSEKLRKTSSILSVSSIASSREAWAVCPSCQRNSLVRRNIRVRISQRTTLAHWFMSTGRSRQLCTQREKAAPMTVSDVGRTTSGRSEEHTSELQSLMRNSYAVFCLNKNTTTEQVESVLPRLR